MSTDPSLLGAQSFETAVLTRRRAEPGDIDELGHVNNAVYVRWVQDAAVAHWMAVAPPALRDTRIWVCLRHEIDYREEVKEGEEVEIRTWLADGPSGARFDRHVDIRKTGAKRFSARALTTWVMLDRETGRPQRVGRDVMEAFGLDH
jgi:acyl-CoA thioester hydrolase